MKSAMIAAALCAALIGSAPMAVQAKGMSNKTDVELYCSFFPYTAKCAPAKPAAVAAVKPAKVAAVKPAKIAAPHVKTAACSKADAGAKYLYTCTWK